MPFKLPLPARPTRISSPTLYRLPVAGARPLQNNTAPSTPTSTNQLFALSAPSKHFCTALAKHQQATMTSMPATHGHSAACCNIPPVISDNYVPKGTYEKVNGLETYVTGPVDATKGLISIFDIFGFVAQTLQGADILALGNQKQTHKVFMPDWFNGNSVPAEWYPPDTEEKQKKLGEWFGNNNPGSVAAALPQYVRAAQAANPSIKSWAILGYCWGGKVVELVTSSDANPFAAAAAAHPAMIDPKGADKITVPFVLLASGEDPADDVKAFESSLKVTNHVETFKDQVHGWMAARADLSDERKKAEYARGYQTVLDFFGKHWQ